MQFCSTRFAAAILLGLGLCAAPVLAAEHDEMIFTVEENFDGLTLAFEVTKAPDGLGATSVTVTGPRDYSAFVESRRGLPKIDLREFGKPFDGNYSYEIVGSTKQSIEVNTPVDNNGRTDTARKNHRIPVMTVGNFRIEGGKIVKIDKSLEEGK